jgi:hypothetical protein
VIAAHKQRFERDRQLLKDFRVCARIRKTPYLAGT